MPEQRAGAPQAGGERAPARRRLRATVEAAYARFVRMEQPLQERLLAYLASKLQARPGTQPTDRLEIGVRWGIGCTQPDMEMASQWLSCAGDSGRAANRAARRARSGRQLPPPHAALGRPRQGSAGGGPSKGSAFAA